MHFGHSIARRIGDARFRTLGGVQQRGTGGAGDVGVEDGGQQLVLDNNRVEGALGDRHRVGDNSGNALATEAKHRVEHQ